MMPATETEHVCKQQIKRQQQHSIIIYNLLAFECVLNGKKLCKINTNQLQQKKNVTKQTYSANSIRFEFNSIYSNLIKCNKSQFYHDKDWFDLK